MLNQNKHNQKDYSSSIPFQNVSLFLIISEQVTDGCLPFCVGGGVDTSTSLVEGRDFITSDCIPYFQVSLITMGQFLSLNAPIIIFGLDQLK